MYKLENNVEWTNDLKDAFKHNITRAKIVYDNTEINYDNGIKELTLEDSVYVPDVGFIGQSTSKKLTLILLDNEQTINLENKEFELYIGADYNNQTYYINYGKFIVNEPPENDSTNGTIKIIAYDYMIKFNKIYQDEVTYPIKLKDYLSNICTQAGVQLGSQTFPNQNFWVSDNQFEGKQLREVIKHIAKCAFSWARIGQDNKLYLDFNATGNVTETFGLDDYKQDGFKRANEYYGPINKVTYADSDIQGQEKSVPDESSIALIGTKELVIYDNFFAYTTQKRQDLIQSGNVLFGFNYMPVTQLELTGAIYLDCTDIIQVIDDKNNTITTRVFSHTIKYNGVISDTVSAPALSNNQETYKNINTTTNAENRTEIMVDRANKKIQSITSQIGDRSQKITTITQDIDGINSKVEDIEDLTRTATGNQTVTISDAYPNEDILELHIWGNNSVFNYLYPRDDLYPEDTLYPYGDSRIRFYNDEEDRTIELNIMDVLRANDEVKDELFIDYKGNVSLIRRVNSDGTTKQIPTNTLLGELHFKLIEGDNTFEIVNYVAPIEVKYAIKSTYTDIFSTKLEMETSIKQTAEEINSVVARKVDGNQFGTYIRQNYLSVQYAWNQISEYIKFEAENNDAVLNIYDENDYRLMRLSKNGQEFYSRFGNKIGSIGVIRGEDKDTLAFAMPVDWENVDNSRSMAWGVIGPNGNFLPIFYLAGYYGEEQSEYGGELVVEGKLLLDEVQIANHISLESTAGVVWGDYEYIRPEFSYHYGQFNKWLKYSTTYGHEFYVNDDWIFSITQDNLFLGKPIYMPYGNNSALEGYPMLGINLDYRYFCTSTNGNEIGFYVNDNFVGSISDKRLKKDFKKIDEKFLKAIDEIEIQQFKADNRNGLISFGIIAQELKEKFKKYEISPEDYEILQRIQYNLNDKELYYKIEYTQFLVLKQLATDKKIEELQKKDKEKDEIIKDLLKRIERLEGK